jgi:nucleotide-binding universal stress UspA family protein
MKRRKILVPIDFTEVSSIGLNMAIDIAQQIDADIDLLHIIKDHSTVGFQTDADMQANSRQASEQNHFMIELIKKRKNELSRLLESYKSLSVKMNPFIEFGNFSDQFEKHLQSNPPNLVVMGSTGETSISEFFTGNHAAKAIRIANVPVLAVTDYHPLAVGDNMLILTSLEDYDLQKVALIKRFADLMELNVSIAHVKQFKDLVMGDLYKKLQKFALENNFFDSTIHVIGKEEKIKAVKQFVEHYDISIIASISKGETGLTRLIFGSDTEKFLSEIDKPLLAVSQ